MLTKHRQDIPADDRMIIIRDDYGLLIFPSGERLVVVVLSAGDNSPADNLAGDLPNHPVVFFFGDSTAVAVLATPLTFSRRNFLIDGEDS